MPFRKGEMQPFTVNLDEIIRTWRIEIASSSQINKGPLAMTFGLCFTTYCAL